MSKDLNEKIDFGASVPEVKSHEQLVNNLKKIGIPNFLACRVSHT
jgi:hypothetical protein